MARKTYNNELQYLTQLLESVDITVNTTVLSSCIANAYVAIRNYLRLKQDDDCSAYFNAACELAKTYYNNELVALKKVSGARPITQKTQGSRSITFGSSEIEIDSRGLTEKVKALLPYPSIWAV